MKTQQLVPPYEVTVRHARRLSMYHEGGREVTEDLELHHQHQVIVKWLGLDESSWEPAANLLDDIPVVFRKWVAANKEDPAVTALSNTLDFP
ncbi:hypothetical protein H257_05201 [Aphanomyces astaci]|uniref:Chromo domain-containing protein n=1 Tax=Aphanomyces astaci TaxID=112090 RepID=W4GTJ2_APHAT|nr:hypothetical protein H257_05201 [Aphanomyces astaci]ETV82621.1 hypothetical protein H257_05201 [Aphanomyces astaci]|eukprot:XP_009828290.1 hypothetical protein H257_05201 [Aphanomyces astaci]